MKIMKGINFDMKERRTLKYLIVSACLALLLASIGGIVVGASDVVETDAELNIWRSSLNLGDNISIIFAVEESVIDSDGDGSLDYSVYTYATNPTGTAGTNGTKLTTVRRNQVIGDTEYALFFTQGFAPVEYGETVYARVENPEAGKYGTVKKISVIELVKGLQGQLDENNSRYEAKKGLYESILKYATTAQAVLGDEYPVYKYFTVEGGTYDDGTGAGWTSGVVESGTEITLSTPLTSDVIGLPMSWNDGVNNHTPEADGSLKVTVSEDDVNYATSYTETVTDTNYVSSTWTGTSQTIYRYESLVKEGKVTPTSTASKLATLSYANDAIKLSYHGKYYTGKDAVQTGTVDSGTAYFLFQNRFSNTNVVRTAYNLSFTLDYSVSADVNGNGVLYEAYGVEEFTETTDDSDGEDTIVKTPLGTYENGDFFRGSGNIQLSRFLIRLTDSETSSAGITVLYVNTLAVVDKATNTVTGFQVGTSAGGADKNKTYESKVYDIKTPHDISIITITGDDGAIVAFELYVDGELVRTALVSNGMSECGWEYAADEKKYMSGDKSFGYYGFGYYQPGRTLCSVAISDLTSTIDQTFSASQIEANGYSTTMKSVNTAATVVGYDSTGTLQHYAWNTLSTLENVSEFGYYGLANSYATPANGSWKYDAEADSVIVTKAYGTTTSQGGATFIIANPLYQMADTWNGEAAVLEFTLRMHTDDMNDDGLYDSALDTNNSASSTVWGQLLIGYGDGVGGVAAGKFNTSGTTRTITGITSAKNVLGSWRIKKLNNETTDYNNQWAVAYWNQSADSGTDQVSERYTGTYANFRIVVTPDETGKPWKLSMYCNNVYIGTRYNVEVETGNDYTGFSIYSADGSKGAVNSLFAAEYFEITQWFHVARIGTAEFSNFRTWLQTDSNK